MKSKIGTLIVFMLVSMIGYGQSVESKTYSIQSRALKFTTNIPIKSTIIQRDSGIVYYNTTYLIQAGTSVQSAISTGKLVKGTITATTLRATTLSVTNISAGTATATVSISAPSVAATTTLVLPGTKTVVRSSNNANCVTFSGSLSAGSADTVFASVTSTGKVDASTVFASGIVSGEYVAAVGTDTVTAAPIGAITYRAADSTIWIKIKLTGPKSARWQKVTVGK